MRNRVQRPVRRQTSISARLTHVILWLCLVHPSAAAQPDTSDGFPEQLVDWELAADEPVFTAGGASAWDTKIRERGWIVREADGYHLWYTGYDGTRTGLRQLGYATSPDGLRWTRWPANPLRAGRWIEDMTVVKHGDTYFMFAEGAADNHAELLTSKDRVHWQWEGPLDVRLADGTRPAQRPCGTPTLWIEGDTWYLLYEWLDKGVWLAKSRDPLSRVWTNVVDMPVLSPGPDAYDKDLIAIDQVIRYGGAYFAFYHASGGGMPRTWNTNIARSHDLIHWVKYAGNPIIDGNRSSGVVVGSNGEMRMYTMHDRVEVFRPDSDGEVDDVLSNDAANSNAPSKHGR